MAEKNHSNKSISENNKTQQAPEKQDMKEKKHGKEKEKFSTGENPDYNAEDFSTD